MERSRVSNRTTFFTTLHASIVIIYEPMASLNYLDLMSSGSFRTPSLSFASLILGMTFVKQSRTLWLTQNGLANIFNNSDFDMEMW